MNLHCAHSHSFQQHVFCNGFHSPLRYSLARWPQTAGCALELRVVRERVLGLGQADGQLVEAKACEQLHLLLGRVAVLDGLRAVDLRGDCMDLESGQDGESQRAVWEQGNQALLRSRVQKQLVRKLANNNTGRSSTSQIQQRAHNMGW